MLGHSLCDTRRRQVELIGMMRIELAFMMQETQMNTNDIWHAFRALADALLIIASGEGASSGDVAVIISKAICEREPVFRESERGRVMHVTCASGGGRLDPFVLHAMRRVCLPRGARQRRDMRRRLTDSGRSSCATSTSRKGAAAVVSGAVGLTAPRIRLLQAWTEVSVSGTTHITPDGTRFSAIDRVRVLLPRSLLASARPQVSVRARLERVHHLGQSDHAPVEVSWPSAFQMPADSGRFLGRWQRTRRCRKCWRIGIARSLTVHRRRVGRNTR